MIQNNKACDICSKINNGYNACSSSTYTCLSKDKAVIVLLNSILESIKV